MLGSPGQGPWRELWGIWAGGETEQYFPLSYTSFWLERWLYGPWPAASHAINLALHATNALLFARVLQQLGVRGAGLAGAIFALHPVHVESVAWIVERKNVLSGLCYLLAWRAYLRSARNAAPGFPGAALGWFAAALFAKSASVTLPAALVLGRLRLGLPWTRRDVLALLPFFALALALALVALGYERAMNPLLATELSAGPAERLALAGANVWFYLKTLVAPCGLALVYEGWRLDPTAPNAYLPAAGVLVLLAGLWALRPRWGDGPLLGFLFYLGTLLPVLGFFPFYYLKLAPAADHFQYLPSLGPIAVFAAAATRLADRHDRLRRVGRVAAGALLAVLGALTWSQCRLYRDDYTIWEHTLRRSPGAWVAHGMFARAAARRGEVDAALAHYREEIRRNPRGTRAYVDLGELQQALGREQEAEASYRAAIRADARFPAGHLALARLELARGRYEAAARGFERVLELELTRDRAGVHCERAVALARLGRLEAAESAYREALHGDDRYAPAHLGLAQLRHARGALREAVVHYERALEIDPELARAHLGLARALEGLGRSPEARAHRRRAFELEPGLREEGSG